MIGIIVAMNADRLIGLNNQIPWKYPGDMARFKRLTMGSTAIMGRKTWESVPARFRPLAGRNNVVVTAGFVTFGTPGGTAFAVSSVKGALLDGVTALCGDVWFIGGQRIYAEAMQHADVIDVTHVPDHVAACGAEMRPNTMDGPDGPVCGCGRPSRLESGACGLPLGVYFPPIDEAVFMPGAFEQHPDEAALRVQRFERRYLLKDNAATQASGSLSRVKR